MTDADGIDWPPLAHFPPPPKGRTMNTIPSGATAPSRRRKLLEQEAAKHEAKAQKAREHAEAIGDIPDADPFPSPTVLMIERGSYTYVALKIAGYWYTTGDPRFGLNRANWGRFVDWLVDGGVTHVYPMVRGELATLGELVPQPAEEEVQLTLRRMPCQETFALAQHAAHAWGNYDGKPVFWCPGQDDITPR